MDRTAVKGLYRSRDFDLRASLMDLNFWCQMSIGGDKGGLGWFLKRWPPGSDTDANGSKLRVLSKGSFHEALINPVHVQTGPVDALAEDEDLSLQAWTEHGLDPSVTSDAILEDAFKARITETADLASVESRSFFCEIEDALSNLSDADIFSRIDLPTTSPSINAESPTSLSHQTPLDPTEPPMLERRRQDYIDGYHLLQTDHRKDFGQFDSRILTFVHLKVREKLRKISNTHHKSQADTQAPRNPLPSQNAQSQASASISSISTSQLRSTLTQHLCSLDETATSLATDVASYVRSICAYDLALEEQRSALNNGLEAQSKRQRKTRAALSALEGGQRSQTRLERWFASCVK